MLGDPASFEETRKRVRIREGEENAFRRFMKRFGIMLPTEIVFEDEGRAARRLKRLQEWVHGAWKEPDPRARFYRIFRILDGLHKLECRRLFANEDSPSPDSFTVPVQTPFERALHQMNRAPDLAKFCFNPDCPAPTSLPTVVARNFVRTSAVLQLREKPSCGTGRARGNRGSRPRENRKAGPPRDRRTLPENISASVNP